MASDQNHVVFHDDKTTGGAEWQKAVDAEIAARPVARPVPGPLTPAELELHRQRGAAARGKNKAEVFRLDGLIRQAEQERRG